MVIPTPNNKFSKVCIYVNLPAVYYLLIHLILPYMNPIMHWSWLCSFQKLTNSMVCQITIVVFFQFLAFLWRLSSCFGLLEKLSQAISLTWVWTRQLACKKISSQQNRCQLNSLYNWRSTRICKWISSLICNSPNEFQISWNGKQ